MRAVKNFGYEKDAIFYALMSGEVNAASARATPTGPYCGAEFESRGVVFRMIELLEKLERGVQTGEVALNLQSLGLKSNMVGGRNLSESVKQVAIVASRRRTEIQITWWILKTGHGYQEAAADPVEISRFYSPRNRSHRLKRARSWDEIEPTRGRDESQLTPLHSRPAWWRDSASTM